MKSAKFGKKRWFLRCLGTVVLTSNGFAFIQARRTVQVAKMVFWIHGFNGAMVPLCIETGQLRALIFRSSKSVRHIAENHLGFLEEIRCNARTHQRIWNVFPVNRQFLSSTSLRIVLSKYWKWPAIASWYQTGIAACTMVAVIGIDCSSFKINKSHSATNWMRMAAFPDLQRCAPLVQ